MDVASIVTWLPMQKRGNSGDGSGGPPDKRQRTDPWRKPEDIPSNGGFEEYYKEQGVCPPEVRPLTTLAHAYKESC